MKRSYFMVLTLMLACGMHASASEYLVGALVYESDGSGTNVAPY